MARAGREPAEDVKRRLMAACQEVGLMVVHASMHLLPEAGARIVHVGASLPRWPHDSPTIALMALVPVTGEWPDCIGIRCCATEGDPVQRDGPWMKGRDKVPFSELMDHLQDTLSERAQVIAAVNRGIPGPHRFEHSVWERVRI